MQANEYQQQCRKFDNHLPMYKESALVLGLCAEAGEVLAEIPDSPHAQQACVHAACVANEYERWARQGPRELNNTKIAAELGDVLWNVARLADQLGFTLEDLFTDNIQKLEQRYEERGIPLEDA